MLHLLHFSPEQLDKLADELPKGRTWRLYGGNESRDFSLEQKLIDFVKGNEGQVAMVMTKGNEVRDQSHYLQLEAAGVPISTVQWENEHFALVGPEPGFWGAIRWWLFRTEVYREAGRRMADQIFGWYSQRQRVFNIPVMVTQNPNWKAYAEGALSSDAPFDIGLNVYGRQRDERYPEQLRQNLAWISARKKNRRLRVVEYNPCWYDGQKRTNLQDKNSDFAVASHRVHMATFSDFGVIEVLLNTVAGNETTASWANPPYFHQFQMTGLDVANTMDRVLHG